MAGEHDGEMQIGKVLKDARTRTGLDVRAIEERTKIRIKYLRAIENEEWGVLPSPAYAKGFLRSYAQALGLDGEALVDEYRRQVETGQGAASYPRADQVLERRHRPGVKESRPRLALMLALVALAVVGGLVLVGLIAGDEDGEGRDRRAGDARTPDAGAGAKGEGTKAPARPAGTVELGLAIRAPVEVCLIGGGGEALIDGQVLAAGTRESYERARFELRLPSGFEPDQLALELDRRPRALPAADGPVAFEIVAPQRLKRLPAPPGRRCP